MKITNATDIHSSTGKMEVFMFNVGQGDHSMIRLPNGEYGIIDFHYNKNLNIPEPPCLIYFKELEYILPKSAFEKITIAFICISHTDLDHIKGAAQTIEWFYSKGIFIKEIWLGAGREGAQMLIALKNKLTPLLQERDLSTQLLYQKSADRYNKSLTTFFEYLKKWQSKEFNNIRYQTEQTGQGEYLSEIRAIKTLCNKYEIEAINMGPLQHHLDKHYNDITFDTIQIILGSRAKSTSDSNLISPILRIVYGKTNLLFGGDTNIEIWEDCLERYMNDNYSHKKQFGPIESSYIKVSHHGAAGSSNPKLWSEIMSSDCATLGISAGQNKKYNHPHAETLKHIRSAQKGNSQIFATNICSNCINNIPMEKDLHEWYDNYLIRNSNNDPIINAAMRQVRPSSIAEKIESNGYGLLAYIFEISNNDKECVKVKMAVSKRIKKFECFYESHDEKLNPECYKKDIMTSR